MATLDARYRAGLLCAIACHVERNMPDGMFPEAVTDKIELAAVELLTGVPLSFETIEVMLRMRQSVQARSAARPWATALIDALEEAEL